MAKVFIGMMTYNGECFLVEAIESLLAQSYPDFTLFISDDASTDTTWEICTRYADQDARIVLHRQEKNTGHYANLKFVLDQANTDYFMWACQDDVWEKDFLELCVGNLEKNAALGLAAGNIAEIDSFGRTLREIDVFPSLSGSPSFVSVSRYLWQPEILGKCNIMYSLFRISVIRAIWDMYPQRREWGSDYIFSLAVISHYSVQIEKKVLFKKRYGGMSNPLSNQDDMVGNIRRVGYKNIKNQIFPVARGRFKGYLRGNLIAVQGTPYTLLVFIVLLLRSIRPWILYFRTRNYEKLLSFSLFTRAHK